MFFKKPSFSDTAETIDNGFGSTIAKANSSFGNLIRQKMDGLIAGLLFHEDINNSYKKTLTMQEKNPLQPWVD